MTPDDLRKLADEAKSHPIIQRGTGQSMVQTGQRKTSELLQLERMAPDLARLCAELGEALRETSDWLEMSPTNGYGRDLLPIRAADAALAKLSELR